MYIAKYNINIKILFKFGGDLMSYLYEIRDTAQEAAEAITAAMGIDMEITDDQLTIVAGTGRYKNKIGAKEEEGNLNSGFLYAEALKTGETYVIEDVKNYPNYGPKEEELSEVCCPIILKGEVIGLMGLVAFSDKQKKRLLEDRKSMLRFLKSMAELISSKATENEISKLMKAVLQSTHDGIISIDEVGLITSTNNRAKKLLNRDESELLDININAIWPDLPVEKAVEEGETILDYEVSIFNEEDGEIFYSVTISPIKSGGVGAVLSFRDMADIRKLVVRMTEHNQKSDFEEILGTSKQMEKVRETGRKIANSKSTVLITGESGTGKGLLARTIHSAGMLSSGPFVTINCGAIPDSLLEAELFGYERGAFTGADKNGKIGKFELADGGTVFLDEVGDLPINLQVKLLNVLQNKKIQRIGGNRDINVDIRVIAATNRNLEEMVKDGRYREDLYYRLNVIPIFIPPLRERKEDIEQLLKTSLAKYSNLNNKDVYGFSEEASDLVFRYDWPGNVRELENTIEYTVSMERGKCIKYENMPERLKNWDDEDGKTGSLDETLEKIERKKIKECLDSTGYNLEGKRRAAEILNISESTLYRRMRKFGLLKK